MQIIRLLSMSVLGNENQRVVLSDLFDSLKILRNLTSVHTSVVLRKYIV